MDDICINYKIPICSNATLRHTLGEVQQLGSNPVDAFLPWKSCLPTLIPLSCHDAPCAATCSSRAGFGLLAYGNKAQ